MEERDRKEDSHAFLRVRESRHVQHWKSGSRYTAKGGEGFRAKVRKPSLGCQERCAQTLGQGPSEIKKQETKTTLAPGKSWI